jgi:hypothetical protein
LIENIVCDYLNHFMAVLAYSLGDEQAGAGEEMATLREKEKVSH